MVYMIIMDSLMLWLFLHIFTAYIVSVYIISWYSNKTSLLQTADR